MHPIARPLPFASILAAALVALTGVVCGASAHAEDVRLYGAGETVDPADVARILAPAPELPALGKSRSLRLLDDAPSAQGAARPVAATRADLQASSMLPAGAAAPRGALALPVQFAFDSADILPAARTQLDALAAGIRLLPASQAVVIEGHTDARGNDHYNLVLSERRAEAVKRYLVTTAGLEPTRLQIAGLGETAPLEGRDPMAPENRRVQFRGAAPSPAVASAASAAQAQ